MPSRLITEGRERLAKADEDDPASRAAVQPAERPSPDSAGSAVHGGTTVISPGTLPAPYAATGDGQLTGSEHDDLAACEAALDNLRLAFWAAGKALQTIRDARLYRETHETFEDYVEDRWDMSRPQAYRLIAAWPLAERLSPIGDKKLNEPQIRELLPLAKSHGPEAAVTVYSTVAETDGTQVTAKILHDVVDILPDDHFDPAEAAEQIRAYLAGKAVGPHRRAANPVGTFTTQSEKLMQALHRVSAGGVLRAAHAADPAVVRKVIADLRAAADAMENDVSGQSR